ncbi:two-component system phosphate regulon sensor histidine kinase PhoR [Alkalihalobacillus xiaoxiensis]|uniref:histidine kinase n=1 Tax=Shouchella xiaoxiensis TaxID=766895 RepID=A0ABS2SSK5_9BACI|nr:ATP-binding protein [Shouchella xiaoxiensis]MBM7838477.1 two-component system phosphate regulon sensor histidine kinase PhoR [Shouchella xiaoxiensis]
MSKLRNRFILSIMLVVTIVLLALGLTLGAWSNERYLNFVSERIKNETALAAWAVLEDGFPNEEEAQRVALEVGQLFEARLTILRADGTVIGDSWANPEEMENHLNRPEIERARVDGNLQLRYSDTIGQDLLYFAIPIEQDEELFGYARVGLSVESLNQMNRTVWIVVTASFFLAFFIILLLVTRISKQIIRPIDDATKAAIRLAEGDYQTRTYEDQHKELGQLGRSINVLAYNLQQLSRRHQTQQEQMASLIEHMGSALIFMNVRGDVELINQTAEQIFSSSNDQLVGKPYYDVIPSAQLVQFMQTIYMTEKKQRSQIEWVQDYYTKVYDVYGAPVIAKSGRLRGITIVLHDITEQKKLEQVRKDFVANVSHELKTPVTSIKGFAETLIDGALSDPVTSKQFTEIIWKESDRLQMLIADLLDLSKIEHAQFQLHLEQVSLKEIANEAVALLASKAKDKEMSINVYEEGSSIIQGDSQRLKQIVINLVTNAVAYTPANGQVTISLIEKQNEVELHVVDTGIGINSTDKLRIFERFYRVDRARSRNSGGTGLGLAIVKHLAEAHHAKLQVVSAEGEGTTFTLRFPKKQS